MMKFKYNSDCTFKERVELVSKEIVDEYPKISIDDAKKIAAFDNPIDDKLTLDDKFYRYYMMLLVIQKNHPEYIRVLNDAFDIYNKGLQDDKLNKLMFEIIKYNNGERPDFPIISELYD